MEGKGSQGGSQGGSQVPWAQRQQQQAKPKALSQAEQVERLQDQRMMAQQQQQLQQQQQQHNQQLQQHNGGNGVGPNGAMGMGSDGGSDRSLLMEKEQTIIDLRETVEILEVKVNKLEALRRLKDQKIAALERKLAEAGLA